jgi:hypothetical protein
LEKPIIVYSIQPLNLPFVVGQKAEESEVPRIVRNQIAIRGSKIAGRALTSVGTAAVGYSVVVGSKPTVTKTPLPMTKRQYRKTERLMRGSSRALDPDMRKYSFAKKGMADRGTQHYQRNRNVSARRKAIKVTTLRGAGTLSIAAGNVVPIIAYGYVATQYVDLGTRDSGPTVKTEQIVEDLSYVHAMTLSQVGQGLAVARTTYHAGKTLWNVIT